MRVPVKRILLAEDNPHDRFLLEECFVSAGISVSIEWAPDGEVALRHLLATPAGYDLVILDANLPKHAAVAILEAVRDAGVKIAAPVVILTSMVTPQRQEVLMQLGAHSVVNKPLDLADYDRLALDLNGLMP